MVRVLALRSRDAGFQDTFWPLVEFVPGIPWFNFSGALVNSQLVCRRSQLGFLTFVVECSVLSGLCFLGPWVGQLSMYVMYSVDMTLI